MDNEPCEIEGCTGDHSEKAGPEWGDLAGCVMHPIAVDGETWKMLADIAGGTGSDD